MDKVLPQGEGKPNQRVCDADAAHEMHEMDCGQSSDETLQGGTRKRKTNVDQATNLAESEDNYQPTTVSEKHRQLRSILATLLAENSQENLITKILGLLTEITAKKKTSRKRSKTLKETETAKDSPTSNAKPSATPTQESLAKSISAPRQQENDATPPGEQQPLRQPQPSGEDTTKGGQDENAADNDDDGFIKVTNKRKRLGRGPQPDTQKPNEHLKEVRIRPKSKTPMGEWKLEILGYLEKTLEIKREDVTLKYFPKSNTISVRTDSKEVLQKIMENYTYENAKGEKIEVSTYQAYWKKHIKGVIYDADITGEAESLIDLVDSKQVPVVAARRMGNTKTVAITFEGEKLPRSILFNRAMMGKKKNKNAPKAMALRANKTEEEMAKEAGNLFFPQHSHCQDTGCYEREMLAPDDRMDSPFTKGEFQTALTSGKQRTAPGHDKVTVQMLRNLPEETKEALLEKINEVRERGEIPTEWKHSIVIPIPKPGKDHTVLSNYRPISLTPCVCKLMEPEIECPGSASFSLGVEDCSGFPWSEKDTWVATDTLDGAGPLLDTASAKDPLWKAERRRFASWCPLRGVIREAIKLGVHGRALNFIKSFLENRTYSIRYGDFTSASARNGVGVPQGSVLSPLLFNIAMANLPKLLHKIPNLKFTVYADDVTIWTTHGDLTTQQSTLQSGLDAVDSHLNEVGLRASSEKTTYMVVASRKQRIADVKNRIVLSLDGKRIQPSETIKILGVRFEDTGGAEEWINVTQKRCHAALGIIRRICSIQGGASEEVARRMVKALFVSRVCYGAQHFKLTKRQWSKLETLNNHAMRVITGLPRFTPLNKLRQYAQLNSMRETVETREKAHMERLKHTAAGRGILEQTNMAYMAYTLPSLPRENPPWISHLDITDGRPRTQANANPQNQARRERLAKAHHKMVQCWEDPSKILAIYTDAAHDAGANVICAAVVIPRLCKTQSKLLPKGTTVKGGELSAISLALETVRDLRKSEAATPQDIRIFADSAEAISECGKRSSASRKAALLGGEPQVTAPHICTNSEGICIFAGSEAEVVPLSTGSLERTLILCLLPYYIKNLKYPYVFSQMLLLVQKLTVPGEPVPKGVMGRCLKCLLALLKKDVFGGKKG
ncbi:hypothetical protein ISCGN_029673 [Ixodes scapularis]